MTKHRLKPLNSEDIVVWKNEYRTNEIGKYRLNFSDDLWFTNQSEALQYRKAILTAFNKSLQKKGSVKT